MQPRVIALVGGSGFLLSALPAKRGGRGATPFLCSELRSAGELVLGQLLLQLFRCFHCVR